MTRPRTKSRRKRDSNPGSSALEADALPLGQRGGPVRRDDTHRQWCLYSHHLQSNHGGRAVTHAIQWWPHKVTLIIGRPEQVILFRLRTGHIRLSTHVYNKFKVRESEMCPCNADIMTAEHLLQHCQLHDALRRDMWPEQHRHRDCRTSTAALPTT